MLQTLAESVYHQEILTKYYMAYNKINNPFLNQNLYTDLDLSFLPAPNSSDLRTKSNLDSIKQSIMTLLFTNIGERPFNLGLACDMQKMLFEQLDPISTLMLQREISSTLSSFEPRINVLAVNVAQNNSNKNGLDIQIVFNLINSPTIESVSFFLGQFR